MTSRRDLGPPLAIAGAVAVAAAVVAGFLAVGGPGDARDRRLDQMMMGKITDIANIAQCAFNATGSAPGTIEEAVNVAGWLDADDTPSACSLGTSPEHRTVRLRGEPAAVGEVSYEALSANRIKICGHFRRPSSPEACNGICVRYTPFPGLEEQRPAAGVHCYALELKRVLNSN